MKVEKCLNTFKVKVYKFYTGIAISYKKTGDLEKAMEYYDKSIS